VGPRAGLDRCGKSSPDRDSIPDSPARSQSLYQLSYPAYILTKGKSEFHPSNRPRRLRGGVEALDGVE